MESLVLRQIQTMRSTRDLPDLVTYQVTIPNAVPFHTYAQLTGASSNSLQKTEVHEVNCVIRPLVPLTLCLEAEVDEP